MGYGRAISKAVKQAGKKQEANTRGLSGNRNSQGDFMPEDVQMKGVQDSVAPDIQKYIDDVKHDIDGIDSERARLSSNDYEGHMDLLEEKEQFIKDVLQELEDNNIEAPKQLTDMLVITNLEKKHINDTLGPEWANDNANEEPYDIDMTDEDKGIRYAEPVRQWYGTDDESMY